MQVFHPSTNTFSKVSIAALVVLLLAAAWITGAVNRSPYVTQAGFVRVQPVPFSHKHHVGAIGIDCRYCHVSVEDSAQAGIPPTKTCMGCHSQIFAESPMLEPVRESFRSDRSIEWTRVHDLPDFTYFDHSIHVKKGVGCVTCHGRIDGMPLTWREATLHMDWCLACHRDPGPSLRPLDRVFDMTWEPPADPSLAGADLARERGVEKRTDCGACHR